MTNLYSHSAARVFPVPSTDGNDRRQDVVSDIATMLGREIAVFNAHRLSRLAARLDMPVNDLKALELINAFDSISTGQLGQMMGISSGGITALISRLEAAGYVERVRHPTDRRVIAIQPCSDKMHALHAQGDVMDEHAELSASRYEIGQLETVQAYLAQCVRALKKETLRWIDPRRVAS